MPAPAIPQAELPASPLARLAPAKQRNIFLAALLIVLAGLAAYSNSFHAPFEYDDRASIVTNPTIQGGWLAALHPPDGETVAGRPVVNFSFALNYHWGGVSVENYHATNLAIHLLAGLALMGLVRRTLELPGMSTEQRRHALPVALGAALLWTVHPLQTEAVTNVAQRTEALMGLFYLLTIYCFVRGSQSRRPQAWFSLAVFSCLLGALSKEVAVTIPVMVLLYDRTFLADTFAKAWRQRWPWYLALACTWAPLGLEVWSAGTRGGTAGFGAGLGGWEYARVQFRAIFVYLGLSAWPHPLLLVYGVELFHQATPVAAYVGAMVMAAGVVYALWRLPKLGFLGAWFFIILAPSSSVVPVVTEPLAEHRLYLPLAAVVALAVLALYSWAGRRAPAAVALLALAWGWLTFQRNQDYQTMISLWRSNVAASPSTAQAHNNLATGLILARRMPECIQEYQWALALDPSDAKTENSLAFALAETGQTDEALRHFRRALVLQPGYVEARVNLGRLLQQSGHLPEAIAEYLLALREEPASAELRVTLGNVYNAARQPAAALAYYQSAVARAPALEQAHLGLGNTWALSGHWADAAKEYEIALKLDPRDYFARFSLGEVLIDLGNSVAARREFVEVLREQPDFTPARTALNALPPASGDVNP